MFTLNARNSNILRRTWYLSNDHVLCARWALEGTAPFTEGVDLPVRAGGNRPITMACETQPMAKCA
jgi:hypothetical protein